MNYLVAHTKAARELGLSGSDAWVYCSLKVLCAKGAWNGSMQQLADESMCGGRMTATRSVDRLIERNVIIRTNDGLQIAQNEQGTAQNEHQNAQNEQNLKEKNQKKNIIKKESLSNDISQPLAGRTDFDLFWEKAAPVGAEKRYRKACQEVWCCLPESWRKKALEKIETRDATRNLYWWLKDEDYLQSGAESGEAKEQKELRVLNGIEADMAKAQGVKVVVAQLPDGSFKMVLAQDAEAWGLKVEREF